jgi:hypothetical protein
LQEDPQPELHRAQLLQAQPPLHRPTPAPRELWLLELEQSTALELVNVHVSAAQQHSPTLPFKALALSAVFQVSYSLPFRPSEFNFNSKILGAMPLNALMA